MRISRSKIERFYTCPRCGWLEFVHKLSPPSIPFTLNMAVDELLKKEFDKHRAEATVHPVVKHFGFDFIPLNHPRIDDWRSVKKGVERSDSKSGFDVFGAVDDLWVDSEGRVIVVDYKATAKTSPVTQLGTLGFHDGYRRQLDVYSWLLQGQADIEVSEVAFWLYVTGRKAAAEFGGHLVFDPALIEYRPDVSWVEPFLMEIAKISKVPTAPNSSEDCEQCQYRAKVDSVLQG